jgi:hypothetical protein
MERDGGPSIFLHDNMILQIGWWIGIAEGENDPYGRIINISSAYGRYIAKSYSARQITSLLILGYALNNSFNNFEVNLVDSLWLPPQATNNRISWGFIVRGVRKEGF